MNECFQCGCETANTEAIIKTALGTVRKSLGPYCNRCLVDGKVEVEPRYQPFLSLMIHSAKEALRADV